MSWFATPDRRNSSAIFLFLVVLLLLCWFFHSSTAVKNVKIALNFCLFCCFVCFSKFYCKRQEQEYHAQQQATTGALHLSNDFANNTSISNFFHRATLQPKLQVN